MIPAMATLGSSDLEVFPLCLGCNPFGWTASEAEAFAVLDAYVAAGGNFLDTADSYAAWVEGNQGGESERMIGRWLAARGNRDRMVIATKVGRHPAHKGLREENVHRQLEKSLRNLQTDRVDLFYAHEDDTSIPLEEALGTLDGLVRAGKVRYLGASNFEASRLAEALETSARSGLAAYVALQPHYNPSSEGCTRTVSRRSVQRTGSRACPTTRSPTAS
jgi:aryl-alcohol dehydrogenase-like predicted oxidoreductase